MTEFNSKTGEREISMANAIFITQALAEQIKNGFAASILWSFQNGLDSYGGDHGMTARNSPVLNDHYPRPVFYIYHFFQKFMGDRMVWSYSSDTTVKSYATTFSSDSRGIVLVNNSSVSKTVDLDFGSDSMRFNYYWYEVYASNETDKKIFVNGQTSNFSEGGPENYASIPPYYRPVNGNNKFELKPYSVNFIANSDNLLSKEELDNSLNLIIYPNPFDDIINIDQQYEFDHLKLYDINGKLVLQSSKKSIDTKLLKEGVYILKLFNYQSSIQIKIIKVKK